MPELSRGTRSPATGIDLANSTIIRQHGLNPLLRSFHIAVLRHFSGTGMAPERDTIVEVAAGLGADSTQAISALAATDLVHLDAGGRTVTVAYPFSGLPTRHRVRLASGVEVWAMCAIDALGIPAMLDTSAVVSSTDPCTGERVTVSLWNGSIVLDPSSAVVFLPRRCGTGTTAECLCPNINFHADRGAAHHLDSTSGQVIGVDDALRMGVSAFRDLLRDDV